MLERDEVDIVVGDLAATQGRNEVEYLFSVYYRSLSYAKGMFKHKFNLDIYI